MKGTPKPALRTLRTSWRLRFTRAWFERRGFAEAGAAVRAVRGVRAGAGGVVRVNVGGGAVRGVVVVAIVAVVASTVARAAETNPPPPAPTTATVTSSSPPASPARDPIDGVAAVVERRVITTSEVQAEARLVLLERAGADAAGGRLDAALEKAVLDSMVAQELLALEARRTGVAVREIDIDKSVAAVRGHFDDPDGARSFFARFGVDEELLRGRARRDLAAGALLEKTFADIKVSDDEADAYLVEHRDLVDRSVAKRTLEKSRRDVRFNGLMARLASTIEVRVVWHP